jgi:hypothetical protein
MKQYQVAITTNCQPITCCMKVIYVDGHERENNLLFQCIVSILRVLIIFQCEYVYYSVLYKGGGLELAICACYPWDSELNVGPGATFNNM